MESIGGALSLVGVLRTVEIPVFMSRRSPVLPDGEETSNVHEGGADFHEKTTESTTSESLTGLVTSTNGETRDSSVRCSVLNRHRA